MSLADRTVLGDGSTTASRAGARWRRWNWLLVVAVVAALAGLAALLPEPRTSGTVLAPDNPGDDGTMAVAEVLADQGVDVEYVRTTAEAVAAAHAGSTLLVTSDALLGTGQIAAVVDSPADLVLLDAPVLAAAATEGRLGFGYADTATDPRRVTAQCAAPDARASFAVRAGGAATTWVTGGGSGVALCFPAENDGYAWGTVETDGRRVDVFGDALMFSNARVAEEGNAALALRSLGRHEQLVWYVPSLSDDGALASDQPGGGLADLLPPQALWLGALALLVLLAAAIWRGRRLGPVVSERLPVVVRAAETTRGRARLYRRGRSFGHAAAALRAGAADRCARRLGLPGSAPPEQLVQALARATGRDEQAIGGLLYGPSPTDDAGLRTLARQLDEIESEVHHP